MTVSITSSGIALDGPLVAGEKVAVTVSGIQFAEGETPTLALLARFPDALLASVELAEDAQTPGTWTGELDTATKQTALFFATARADERRDAALELVSGRASLARLTVPMANSALCPKPDGSPFASPVYVPVPGPPGEDGTSSTVAVGETTTLPAGSPATVENVGTESAAVLNFGIPRGAASDPLGLVVATIPERANDIVLSHPYRAATVFNGVVTSRFQWDGVDISDLTIPISSEIYAAYPEDGATIEDINAGRKPVLLYGPPSSPSAEFRAYIQQGSSSTAEVDVTFANGIFKWLDLVVFESKTSSVPAASDATPAMDGTGAAGSATAFSRGDHVHPTDTSRAADSAVVKLTGDQTVAGNKTFTGQVTAADFLTSYSFSFTGGKFVSAPENSGATLTDADLADDTSALGAALAAKADSADLATVATTGAYSDLTGTPTIPSTPAQVGITTETWTFTLSDNSTVTKTVCTVASA